MIVKLTTGQLSLMLDAYRRVELFIMPRGSYTWTIEDLRTTWIFIRTYEGAIQRLHNDGIIEHVNLRYKSRRNPAAWKLSEKGARLLIRWHEQGYTHTKSLHGILNDIPPLETVI